MPNNRPMAAAVTSSAIDQHLVASFIPDRRLVQVRAHFAACALIRREAPGTPCCSRRRLAGRVSARPAWPTPLHHRSGSAGYSRRRPGAAIAARPGHQSCHIKRLALCACGRCHFTARHQLRALISAAGVTASGPGRVSQAPSGQLGGVAVDDRQRTARPAFSHRRQSAGPEPSAEITHPPCPTANPASRRHRRRRCVPGSVGRSSGDGHRLPSLESTTGPPLQHHIPPTDITSGGRAVGRQRARRDRRCSNMVGAQRVQRRTSRPRPPSVHVRLRIGEHASLFGAPR